MNCCSPRRVLRRFRRILRSPRDRHKVFLIYVKAFVAAAEVSAEPAKWKLSASTRRYKNKPIVVKLRTPRDWHRVFLIYAKWFLADAEASAEPAKWKLGTRPNCRQIVLDHAASDCAAAREAQRKRLRHIRTVSHVSSDAREIADKAFPQFDLHEAWARCAQIAWVCPRRDILVIDLSKTWKPLGRMVDLQILEYLKYSVLPGIQNIIRNMETVSCDLWDVLVAEKESLETLTATMQNLNVIQGTEMRHNTLRDQILNGHQGPFAPDAGFAGRSNVQDNLMPAWAPLRESGIRVLVTESWNDLSSEPFVELVQPPGPLRMKLLNFN